MIRVWTRFDCDAVDARRLDDVMLREVLHAGVVVADLDRAVAEWERLFGVRARDCWESTIGVRVAFFDTPGGRIDLVQYTGPIVERFGAVLAGRDGVHHLCFRVDDLDASLRTLARRGLHAVRGFPVAGAHGRVAFLEPEPTTGLIIELCEVARARRDHARPRRRH
jgi:methylmalonyl-CoA/ethylmalonyl-CoA epimerase